MNNELYIRRRNAILLPTFVKSGKKSTKAQVATVLKNIESLGFTFTKSLINALSELSFGELTSFYAHIVPLLKTATGANVRHKPMYPNFPDQVMEMDEAELYVNAIMHYIGDVIGLRILPETEVKERFPLIGKYKLRAITLGTEKEFNNIFTQLVGTNGSISATDQEDIKFFINDLGFRIEKLLPDSIPSKEVLSFLGAQLVRNPAVGLGTISHHFKTATDVLRLATALCNGDVSLAENTKYTGFKRSTRKLLLGLLEHSNDLEENLFVHQMKWIRLAEVLHPGEYAKKFPKTAKAFKALRADKPTVQSLNSQVEELLLEKKWTKAAKVLMNRPGQFARRLDHLLRSCKTENQIATILKNFTEVVGQVSTPVLLQVSAHFENRNSKATRVVMPKGNVAKVFALENEVPEIRKTICTKIRTLCLKTIRSRYAALSGKLGKVYVDPKLKDFPIPFSQRSASKSLLTVSRGSKLDLDANEFVRFFIHWKDSDSRVDVDLSAVMFDDQWNMIEQVSYTNLRSANYRAVHSGDITSAPNGASEFIDLDIESAIEHGARYIGMTVFCFTGQDFATIPECFAGWMSRTELKTGEIFEPKTVKNKIDLNNKAKAVMPMVIDLVERKVIWMDVAMTGDRYSAINNLHRKSSTIKILGKSMSELKKPDLFTLFKLHGEARGKLVDDRKKADVVFSVDEGVTPFQIEKIMSEFLV